MKKEPSHEEAIAKTRLQVLREQVLAEIRQDNGLSLQQLSKRTRLPLEEDQLLARVLEDLVKTGELELRKFKEGPGQKPRYWLGKSLQERIVAKVASGADNYNDLAAALAVDKFSLKPAVRQLVRDGRLRWAEGKFGRLEVPEEPAGQQDQDEALKAKMKRDGCPPDVKPGNCTGSCIDCKKSAERRSKTAHPEHVEKPEQLADNEDVPEQVEKPEPKPFYAKLYFGRHFGQLNRNSFYQHIRLPARPDVGEIVEVKDHNEPAVPGVMMKFKVIGIEGRESNIKVLGERIDEAKIEAGITIDQKPERSSGPCRTCHHAAEYPADKDGQERRKCTNQKATGKNRVIRGIDQVRTEGCYMAKSAAPEKSKEADVIVKCRDCDHRTPDHKDKQYCHATRAPPVVEGVCSKHVPLGCCINHETGNELEYCIVCGELIELKIYESISRHVGEAHPERVGRCNLCRHAERVWGIEVPLPRKDSIAMICKNPLSYCFGRGIIWDGMDVRDDGCFEIRDAVDAQMLLEYVRMMDKKNYNGVCPGCGKYLHMRDFTKLGGSSSSSQNEWHGDCSSKYGDPTRKSKVLAELKRIEANPAPAKPVPRWTRKTIVIPDIEYHVPRTSPTQEEIEAVLAGHDRVLGVCHGCGSMVYWSDDDELLNDRFYHHPCLVKMHSEHPELLVPEACTDCASHEPLAGCGRCGGGVPGLDDPAECPEHVPAPEISRPMTSATTPLQRRTTWSRRAWKKCSRTSKPKMKTTCPKRSRRRRRSGRAPWTCSA